MVVALLGAAMEYPKICCAQERSTAAGATAGQAGAQSTPKDSTEKPTVTQKPKHVITNEDLEPRTNAGGGNTGGGKLVTTDNSPLLDCGESCEQEARGMLGLGPDEEAEWRAQIVIARRELAEDTAWRNLLAVYIRDSDSYCHFQLQRTQRVSSNQSDYMSQVQAARNAQYFENMDRVLRQNVERTANRMRDRVQEVQELSPVRAALMTTQTERVSARPCEMPRKR